MLISRIEMCPRIIPLAAPPRNRKNARETIVQGITWSTRGRQVEALLISRIDIWSRIVPRAAPPIKKKKACEIIVEVITCGCPDPLAKRIGIICQWMVPLAVLLKSRDNPVIFTGHSRVSIRNAEHVVVWMRWKFLTVGLSAGEVE